MSSESSCCFDGNIAVRSGVDDMPEKLLRSHSDRLCIIDSYPSRKFIIILRTNHITRKNKGVFIHGLIVGQC